VKVPPLLSSQTVPNLSYWNSQLTFCLQTLSLSRLNINGSWSSLYSLGMDLSGNIAYNSSSILLVCLLRPPRDRYWTTAKQRACLHRRFLATAVFAGFTILAFSRHITVCNDHINRQVNKGAYTWDIQLNIINPSQTQCWTSELRLFECLEF
jgi:hypothetical protein